MQCRLNEIRKQRNKTQKDIANALNVKQNTVSEWENGNKVPNLRKAYELAEYLEMKVIDIWQ